jgi:hypothetical protein
MAAANESPRVSVEKRGFVIVHDTMHESIILRSATSHVFLLYRRQNDDRAHPTLVVRSAARCFVFDLEKTTRVSSALETNSTSRAVPNAVPIYYRTARRRNDFAFPPSLGGRNAFPRITPIYAIVLPRINAAPYLFYRGGGGSGRGSHRCHRSPLLRGA